MKTPSLSECKEINPKLCKILINVLSKIRPSEKKRQIIVFAEKIRREVEEALLDLDIPHKVEIHGSIAHDTWLANDRDIDVFILLEKKIDKERIKKEVLNRLKERLNYVFEQRYAEHPYLRATVDKFIVDIVPGFRVGEIISAVDRTPLHTEFLRKHLVGLHDEVRLLKAFLKGIGAYGAEIRTQGISGYAAELLIVHYKSFLNVLKAFAREKKIFIDFTGSWGKEKAFEEFKSKIIIIDPVDRNRNVTANTSDDTFYLMKLASKMFLVRPSIKFFFPCTAERPNNIDRGRNILVIMLEKNPSVPPDTYWGQAKRIRKLTEKFLKKFQEIQVFATDVFDSDNYIYILIEVNSTKLNKFKEVQGPPVWANMRDILKFISEYEDKAVAGPWLKGSRLTFQVKRNETKLINHLEKFLEKVRLDPSFKKFNILEYQILGIPEIQNALYRFIRRRLPWLECD